MIIMDEKNPDIIQQLRKDLLSYIRTQENVLKLYSKILKRLTWIFIPLSLLLVGGIASMIFLIISNRDFITSNRSDIHAVQDSIKSLLKR